MDMMTLQEKDLQELFAFEDLGAIEEVTGVYANGEQRDGGWEVGHNYSYS